MTAAGLFGSYLLFFALSVIRRIKSKIEETRELNIKTIQTEDALREWREKRRKGRVKVRLDHEEYVDLGRVVEVKNL